MSRDQHDFWDTVLNPRVQHGMPIKSASQWTEYEEPNTIGDLESSATFFKNNITRDYVRADFDNECLQDALVLLLIPDIDTDPGYAKTVFPQLMDQWAAHKIVDPFVDMRQEDQSLFAQMLSFHRCFLHYIQDYLRKATSYYLPRAYHGLPLVLDDATFFKGQDLSNKFDVSCFGVVGRRRLFWAFLRYELMSKVRLYKAIVDDNYTPPSRLNQREGRPFLPWEDEALRCVQVYASSLYAAQFAQWEGVQLPDDRSASGPSNLSCPPGLRSDYHLFQRRYWIKFQARKWSMPEWVMERLGEFGFGLITLLIYDAREDKESRQGSLLLCKFLNKLTYLRYGEWDDVHRECETALGEDTKSIRNAPDLCAQSIRQHGRPIADKAWESCRQRAWVFFDDARVHPQHQVLVDLPEIQADTESDAVKGPVCVKPTGIPRSFYADPDSWYNI